MKKSTSEKTLRELLSKLFDARYVGASNAIYSRTQGFVDGYMQALEDVALFTNSELLKIVSDERAKAAARADVLTPAIPAAVTVENFA